MYIGNNCTGSSIIDLRASNRSAGYNGTVRCILDPPLHLSFLLTLLAYYLYFPPSLICHKSIKYLFMKLGCLHVPKTFGFVSNDLINKDVPFPCGMLSSRIQVTNYIGNPAARWGWQGGQTHIISDGRFASANIRPCPSLRCIYT